MSKGPGVSPFSAGALIARKYRLIRLLAEGDRSIVWRAIDETTCGEVALKHVVRPDPDLRVRLLREAQACAAIRHRNVAQILDVGETGCGDPYVVMELLSGETLAGSLARNRRLEPQETARIGRDIARGLSAAHALGIVHRDLEPANVFLHDDPAEEQPVVKLLDFGAAKNIPVSHPARTARGGAAGSPKYMSPEQARGDVAVDGRSDVWSLGVILFEMLSGAPPIDGEEADVLAKVAEGRVPLLWQKVRNIHPGLSGLVMACLRRDPEERPWPASEIATKLDTYASPRARMSVTSPPAPTSRTTPPTSQATPPPPRTAPPTSRATPPPPRTTPRPLPRPLPPPLPPSRDPRSPITWATRATPPSLPRPTPPPPPRMTPVSLPRIGPPPRPRTGPPPLPRTGPPPLPAFDLPAPAPSGTRLTPPPPAIRSDHPLFFSVPPDPVPAAPPNVAIRSAATSVPPAEISSRATMPSPQFEARDGSKPAPTVATPIPSVRMPPPLAREPENRPTFLRVPAPAGAAFATDDRDSLIPDFGQHSRLLGVGPRAVIAGAAMTALIAAAVATYATQSGNDVQPAPASHSIDPRR